MRNALKYYRVAKEIMNLEDLYDQISVSVLTIILLIKQRGMRKVTVFSISGAESLGYPSIQGGEKNLGSYNTPYAKINSRWLVDLNVKGKVNIGEFLHDLVVGRQKLIKSIWG